MAASAAFLAAMGLGASFVPQEFLETFGSQADNLTIVVVQITGALYLGFAILNWSARGVLIGGIYSRPLAMGNFLHFAVGAATLVKAAIVQASGLLVGSAVVYVVFALWFGLVLFTHPGPKPPANG